MLKRVRSWSSRSRRKKTGDRGWTQKFRNWQSSCVQLAALCAPSAASCRSVHDIQHIQKAEGSVISWASTNHFTKIHFNIILLLIFMPSKFLCNQNITPNACYKSQPFHPLFNKCNKDTNGAMPSPSFSTLTTGPGTKQWSVHPSPLKVVTIYTSQTRWAWTLRPAST